jgi:5-methylthioribose kinase
MKLTAMRREADSVSDQEKDFRRSVSGGFFVDPGRPGALEEHLRRHGLLAGDETVGAVGRAGEGNMNLTLRVRTSRRSLILKQSRPWGENYPQIAAPVDRALVETAFYETVAAIPVARGAMPLLLGTDPGSRLLLLEDLGEAQDFTPLYRGDRLSHPQLDELVDYLVALHASSAAAAGERRSLFENRDMRALNHDHIFRIPLVPDNGLDLDGITPGLAAAAETLKGDTGYVQRVIELGQDYLADGDHLVHGDYFPGSWLGTSSGVRIIDPEFCFLGPRAFDVGTMLGHLHLARQPDETCTGLLSSYRARAGVAEEVTRIARSFAGVEIMRRLIGVAQIPLDYGIEEKERLLVLSRELVMAP